MSGSTSLTLTTPAPPTTEQVAADIIAWIGGQSGVVTDINPGSQVRTDAEALGSVVDMQGMIAQALAFQALVYAAYGAFNISPLPATPAVGTVVFSTGTGANPPPLPYDVVIPAGTLVQTVGGVQFETVTNLTVVAGSTSGTVVVTAVVAGQIGNVVANSVTQVATALPLPFSVTNPNPMTGGTDAETAADTMARFTATVSSIGLGTPVAIANACIGVNVPGTQEAVQYATVYEPWIDQVNQGIKNPTAGFVVYVDNGSGSASGNLLAAVKAQIDGNLALGQEGFRPAGVPYAVSGVVPVPCTVNVSGTALFPSLDIGLEASVTTAVQQYFSGLLFGQPVEWTQIVAAVANVVFGNVTSLDVTLLDVSGSSQQVITPLGTQRALLQTLAVSFS